MSAGPSQFTNWMEKWGQAGLYNRYKASVDIFWLRDESLEECNPD